MCRVLCVTNSSIAPAMAGCMPGLGGGFAREARAAAPRHRGWLPSRPVGDDSDSDEEDTLPARFMFDLRGCVPPSPRPPATQAPSDGCFQEFGAMLRALEDQAAAGAPPQERMMGVCRIVLAHVATWLKPVVKAPLSALRLPGARCCSRPPPRRLTHAPFPRRAGAAHAASR